MRCGIKRCRTYGAQIIFGLIPSPSPDFLWYLVALADFMRLSLLKGARAASSSAAWQEIRVPGWAEVWLPALRAWIRFAVHWRFSRSLFSPGFKTPAAKAGGESSYASRSA